MLKISIMCPGPFSISSTPWANANDGRGVIVLPIAGRVLGKFFYSLSTPWHKLSSSGDLIKTRVGQFGKTGSTTRKPGNLAELYTYTKDKQA